jgi:hypothetical protein
MPRRKGNKSAKRLLRFREKQLRGYLNSFLTSFDLEKPSDEASFDETSNFRLLLKLRWCVYDFIYLRLKLNPKWQKKQWFLELFDVDEINIGEDDVVLRGDIVWWAEGKDAVGEWWPADHEPHWVKPYKVKIRGELSGGYWILEPVIARLRIPKVTKRNAEYEIEFGKGSTYMKISSKRWRKAV